MAKNYLLWALIGLMLVSLIFIYFQGNKQTTDLEETLTALNQTQAANDRIAESNISRLQRTSMALNETQAAILSDDSAASQITELQLTSAALNEAQTAISETIIALLTETPTPTDTATATATFTPSNTYTPTVTFTPSLPPGVPVVTIGRNVYIYFGDAPGEGAREVTEVGTFLIIGMNNSGEYLQIDYRGRHGWVRILESFIIESIFVDIPVIDHPTTATPSATPSSTLTLTFTPSITYTASPTCPAPSTPASVQATVTIQGVITVREGPGHQYDAIEDIAEGIYPIIGLDAEGLYYQIDYEGVPAWIANFGDLRVDGNLNCLPVLLRPTATATPSPRPTQPTFTPRPTITSTYTLVPGVPSVVVESAIQVGIGEFPGEEIQTIRNGTFPILGITPDENYYLVNFNGENGWIDLRSNRVLVVGDVSAIPVITLPKPTP